MFVKKGRMYEGNKRKYTLDKKERKTGEEDPETNINNVYLNQFEYV